MFDLETALAAWRRSLSTNRTFTCDDLDELERHLRDQIAALVRCGLSEKEAFDQALVAMGDYGDVEAEYEKVYWRKLRRSGQFRDEVAWRLSMLRNYVTIALRNFKRHTGYTAINLLGLTVALAACLILGLYITQSLSYDRFHADADRIVRVVHEQPADKGVATMPFGVAHTLRTQFPEVETATDVIGFSRVESVFLRGATPFVVDHMIQVDEHFFDVFSFQVLRGDAEEALRKPYQLILTASTAQRIFGDADPIGQMLRLNGTTDYTVAALAADPPPNTHLPFNVIKSLDPQVRDLLTGTVLWNRWFSHVYVKLESGADADAFAQKLDAFQKANRPPTPGTVTYALQPVTRIYLHSDLHNEYHPTSHVGYLYIFGAAGALILLIACMNYVNLATARALHRAKEVGVRKVVGARRAQLVRQFLGESVLLVLTALPLALILAAVLLPVMNALTGQALTLQTANHPLVWLGVLVLVTTVGFGAGSYPAFTLSAFRPVTVLKGNAVVGRGRHGLRRSLVVFQFAVSVALILGALTVFAQLEYLQSKRLGFDAEQLVTFRMPQMGWDGLGAFKAALAHEPSVQSVAAGLPLGVSWRTFTMHPSAMPGGDEKWDLDGMTVGYDFIETAGLHLVAGRSFSPDFPTDPDQAVILSVSALARFGLTENAVGATVTLMDERTVIGVVEDFHNLPLKESLRPVAILLDPANTNMVLARLAPGQTESGLAALEEAWKALEPDRPFVFEFLDEEIQAQYLAEERLSRVFGLFAGLAIVLATLGLLGLAAFAAQQRTKEIGIRKVLGASVWHIVRLLSREFLVLVGVALVVGMPLAYFATQRWLDDFAYRVEISWLIFLMAGLAALAIAMLTVSYQSIKAALADPVKSLRYE